MNVQKPEPTWRTIPARTSSLWDTASASAGASLSVGSRYRESLVTGGRVWLASRAPMRRPLLALLVVAVAVLGWAADASASKYMASVMQDDNMLIYSSAQNREVALRRMKLLGVDAVRVTVLWDAVAGKKRTRRGQDPGSYRPANWDKYDDVARAA